VVERAPEAERGPLFGSLSDTGSLLRNRNFAPFLFGNLLSGTGTWFQNLAQAILVYRLTHSAFLLGVVGFAQFAAVVVLVPWTGSAADRVNRRTLLIATQLAAIGVTGTLTVLSATGHVNAGVVIALVLALGVSSAFSAPAGLAFIPSLVEARHLASAIALNSVAYNLARVVGPVLAAVVIDHLGVTWAFGINSCSYLGLIAGVLIVRQHTKQVRPRIRPRLRESLTLLRNDRRLLALLYVVAAVSLASDPAVTLGPAFVNRLFDLRDSRAGYLVGAFGVGAVVAAFTLAPKLRGSRAGVATTLGITAAGVVCFALSPVFTVALVGMVLTGFGFLASNTAATTRLQLGVEDALRGRVMALWSIAFFGIRPIGSLVDGALASAIGLRMASLLMALPALAGAVAIFCSNRMSRKTGG
jgi:MFS family permease